MADKDTGIVEASIPGLANRAGVTIEETEAALKSFLSPDPYSRTKDYEGRRIKEVDGGWLLLTYNKHRPDKRGRKADASVSSPNGANPNSHPSPNSKSASTLLENENENENGSSAAIGSSDRPYVAVTAAGTAAVESWHPAEKAAYESLHAERQRKAFEIIRGWAGRAAEMGEATFRISQKHLARELGCKQRNVSDILAKFKKLGWLDQKTAGSYSEGMAAEYRWELESTIKMVPYTGPELNDPF
jgi:hypothetical protein